MEGHSSTLRSWPSFRLAPNRFMLERREDGAVPARAAAPVDMAAQFTPDADARWRAQDHPRRRLTARSARPWPPRALAPDGHMGPGGRDGTARPILMMCRSGSKPLTFRAGPSLPAPPLPAAPPPTPAAGAGLKGPMSRVRRAAAGDRMVRHGRSGQPPPVAVTHRAQKRLAAAGETRLATTFVSKGSCR